MKPRLLASVLCLLVSVLWLSAAEEKSPPPAGNLPKVLKLADGRELAEWRVMSETASAVFVKYKGGGAKVAKTLLPAAVLALYPIDEDAVKAEAEALAAAKRAGAERKAQLEAENAEVQARHAEKAARRQAAVDAAIEAQRTKAAIAQAVAAEPKPPAAPDRAILDATSRHAERYFKTQHRSGSGSTLVFDLSIDLDGVREIPGWENRYEVTGVCAYQFYDSIWGGSFRGTTQHFAADVEIKRGKATVTGFSLRSGPPL